jgi:hypothetical protein
LVKEQTYLSYNLFDGEKNILDCLFPARFSGRCDASSLVGFGGHDPHPVRVVVDRLSQRLVLEFRFGVRVWPTDEQPFTGGLYSCGLGRIGMSLGRNVFRGDKGSLSSLKQIRRNLTEFLQSCSNSAAGATVYLEMCQMAKPRSNSEHNCSSSDGSQGLPVFSGSALFRSARAICARNASSAFASALIICGS